MENQPAPKNQAPTYKKINSEADMLSLGGDFAAKILASETPSAVFELIGDVGVGKTTFTRGLAAGLKVQDPVTSPSFTISKRYAFPISRECCKNYNTSSDASNNLTGQLIHYDFYRLDDPGIMRDELAETLSEPNSVIVVEWGSEVADLLPMDKIRLEITLLEDGSRTVKIINPTDLVNPTDPKSLIIEPISPTESAEPSLKEPSL